MIYLSIVHVIVILKAIIENVCVLLINIESFVMFSYFSVEYIKFFYLLQKSIDQITSKKLNLYDENMLITLFINLYNNIT